MIDFYIIIDNEETKNLFSRLLTQSPNLTEIHLFRINNGGLMQIAGAHCAPSLHSIKAKVGRNSLEAIKSLCQACPNLINLDLECDFGASFGNELIPTIVQCCPLIEVLPTGLYYLTDTAMNALSTIHTLTAFKLASNQCTSAAIQSVLRANPHLTVLTIDTPAMDDALVNCIGNHCRNLTDLTITIDEAQPPSDVAVCELFRGSSLLRKFKLNQISQFSDDCLRALFQNCHNLKELDVFFDYAPNLAQIEDIQPVVVASYPTLTKLRVVGGGVADTALRSLLTHCINLDLIELQGRDQMVTDETIRVLAQNCTKLDTLHLIGCHSLTVAAMLDIATYCTNLRVLVCYHALITDEVLIRLSLHCTGLTTLRFLHCRNGGGPVTEAGILAVLQRCTGLTFLTIRGDMMDNLTPILEQIKQGQLYKHIKFDMGGFP